MVIPSRSRIFFSKSLIFTIGFGLFPPGVLAFKGHAAFHRVSEELGVLAAPRSS
jgi:hypothetical protein